MLDTEGFRCDSLDSSDHFFGGSAGKRQQQDTVRINPADDKMRNPMGKRAFLDRKWSWVSPNHEAEDSIDDIPFLEGVSDSRRAGFFALAGSGFNTVGILRNGSALVMPQRPPPLGFFSAGRCL